jgi:hypothetical protein
MLDELLAVACGCAHADLHEPEWLGVDRRGRGELWSIGRCPVCKCPGGREGWPATSKPAEVRAERLRRQQLAAGVL